MARKRVTIPRSELTPIDGQNEYLIRFRVISDDRNRFSDWSQVFSVSGVAVSELPEATVAYYSSGSVVNIVWEGLPAGSEFDMFVGFNGDEPSYRATTSETRWSFINTGQSSYKFAIQISSVSKEYDELLQIFESDLIDVV